MQNRVLNALDHKLCNTIPATQDNRFTRIQIDQGDRYFSPVSGVDGSWRIHK
jgi:hypothetical protein